MIPIIRKAIENGGTAEMTVTGNSMMPLLKHRVSSVRLIKAENLKTGDIVLFHRNDGHYVLHRIVSIRDGAYDIVGDNQHVPDRNIQKDAIIARVAEYNRTGKRWKDNDALYRVLLPAVKAARYYGYRIKSKLSCFRKRK